MINNEKYGVIGSGKLGLPLAHKLMINNKLSRILLHSDSSKEKVLKFIPDSNIIFSLLELVRESDFIIIAVNDINLYDIISELAKFDLSDKILVHTSGIYSLEILDRLTEKNAKIAAAHPFQTFYRYTDSLFDDAPWGIECDSEVLPDIETFVKHTSGSPIYLGNITQEQKVLYHLSAVIASNTTIALLDLARDTATAANINYIKFIPKIIETTIQNVYNSWENNDKIPLTGPVARGDSEAIKIHLNALKFAGINPDTYLSLAKMTAHAAFNHKIINSEQLNNILQIQNGENDVNS